MSAGLQQPSCAAGVHSSARGEMDPEPLSSDSIHF
jgi:hypothetical protein